MNTTFVFAYEIQRMRMEDLLREAEQRRRFAVLKGTPPPRRPERDCVPPRPSKAA